MQLARKLMCFNKPNQASDTAETARLVSSGAPSTLPSQNSPAAQQGSSRIRGRLNNSAPRPRGPATGSATDSQRASSRWENLGYGAEEVEARRKVTPLIDAIRAGTTDSLLLTSPEFKNLTCLPELPPELKTLEITADRLISLPTLPEGIETLKILSEDVLTLPALPDSLTTAHLYINSLLRLDALPRGLMELHVTSNWLETIPSLPHGLQRLLICGRHLTHLPALPQELKYFALNASEVTRLPTCPASLTALHLNGCESLDIPEHLMHADSTFNYAPTIKHWQQANAHPVQNAAIEFIDPDDAALPISDVELNEALRLQLLHDASAGSDADEDTILALTLSASAAAHEAAGNHAEANEHGANEHGVSEHRASELGTSMFDASGLTFPPEQLSREASLDLSLPPRALPSTRPRGISGWTPSATQNATGGAAGAQGFHRFLERLQGIDAPVAPQEYASLDYRPAFVARVDILLDAMENSPELRTICLALAQDTNESCGDRVGLALNDMEAAHINDKARLGHYNEMDLYKLGRGFMRLGILDGIASQTIQRERAKGRFEDVQVRLAYHTHLATRLDLPAVGHAMLHFGESKLTEEDLDSAAEAVLRKERQTGGLEFLVRWHPWQEAMKRRDADTFMRRECELQTDRDHYAVLPKIISEQMQRQIYEQIKQEKTAMLENFTRTQTVLFLTDNQHCLEA